MIRRGAVGAVCPRARLGLTIASRNGNPRATPLAPRRNVRLSRYFMGASRCLDRAVEEGVGLRQGDDRLAQAEARAGDPILELLLSARVGRRLRPAVVEAEELGRETAPHLIGRCEPM